MKLVKLLYATLDGLISDINSNNHSADVISITPDGDRHAVVLRMSEQRAKLFERAVAFNKEKFAGLQAPLPIIDVVPPCALPAPTGAKKLYIVMNEQGSEGVVFDDKRDAEWTQTGRGVGSSGFGVPCIGEEFRESYSDGTLTLHEISADLFAA